MNKKQIIIIIVVGVVAILITICTMYLLLNKGTNNTPKTENINEIEIQNYTLKYGKYKGVEEEYDPNTEKVTKKEVSLELTKTMIIIGDSKQTYTIQGNKLVTQNKIEYEVMGNNKIKLLAGGGIEYEYKG